MNVKDNRIRLCLQKKGIYMVRFQEQQLATTPGQFAVFYNDDGVIGGEVVL
jgi:tRNA U34 2-thiouridine synthase MnmA/TrmU